MKEILKKHLTNILKSGIMSKFAAKPNGSLELVEDKKNHWVRQENISKKFEKTSWQTPQNVV